MVEQGCAWIFHAVDLTSCGGSRLPVPLLNFAPNTRSLADISFWGGTSTSHVCRCSCGKGYSRLLPERGSTQVLHGNLEESPNGTRRKTQRKCNLSICCTFACCC